MDALHRYTTGPRAIWRVLAMRRDANTLRVAVEWPRRRKDSWYALVTLSFTDRSLVCQFKPTANAARAELRAMVASDARSGPAVHVNGTGGAA